jgi:surface protein
MKKITILLLAITFSTASYSQLTDANFQTAINTCLSTNPEDGLCSDSEYGSMPDWDVSSVTDMSNAFEGKNTFNGDISGWDTSSVIDIEDMFYGASSFNGDISSWNTSSVTTMYGMFDSATEFNQDISNWDVVKVTDMRYMFAYAESFNQDISSWNVSSVTYMSYMFNGASSFNQDISFWDVSNVVDMNGMFSSSNSFNQNISNWCVTNIITEPTNFSNSAPLSESNKPVWGSCPTASIEDQNQLDISIYPNPTSDIVYIEGNYTQLKVVIYNVLGKEILNKSITNRIDISHLDNGVYILQLSDGVKLSTRKIIKN